MHSSIAAASAVSRSHSSAGPGMTAASSTTARAASPISASRSATASRTLAGTPPPSGRRQRLGDEERVAARDGVQVGGIAAGPLRELGDGVGATAPLARSAASPRAAARRARAGPRAGLGPAGDDHAARRAGQAPPEQRDEVERRVVGPVQVLDHEHGAARPARSASRRGRARGRRPRSRIRTRRRGRSRDVAQRPHRPRRDQRVAGAPQHAVRRPGRRRRRARSCRSRPPPRPARPGRTRAIPRSRQRGPRARRHARAVPRSGLVVLQAAPVLGAEPAVERQPPIAIARQRNP